MARTNDGDELAQLTAIVDMMRAKGVIKIVTKAGTEILMGPPLPSKTKDADKDPRAAKRAHYLNLLGVSKSDEELDMLP